MAQREVMTGKPETLDEMIVRFYDAILEPGALLRALTEFDRWIGSRLAHMVGWDARTQSAPVNLMTRAEYMHAGEAYAEYYGKIDPRRAVVLNQPVGCVFQCADYFDNRYVDRSEFYQDLLIPNGMRYILGGCVFREDALDIYLVFNHAVGQPSFSPQQAQAVGRLMPHLQKTLKLMLRSESLRAGIVAGEMALEAMDQAIVVLSPGNEVVFCNRSAEALFRAQHILRVSGRRIESASFWSDALSGAIGRVRASGKPESVPVSAGAQPRYLTVLALPRALGTGSGLTLASADIMIVVTEAERSAAASERQLSQLFGLTGAEARLAHGLAKGLSIEEYANAFGVTVTTARNQLRAVLSKTGYRRQQDLVRALSALPAIGGTSVRE
jgi:DNA-binding CsgD family transcriptional regulator/PAS domain-containing protein